MEKINNEGYNVDKLFTNYYVVPDYQREYVWEEKNVNQLLDDVYDEYVTGNKSEYFIGSTVVCKSKENKSMFEVIDGQQRLTTLFICLCAFKQKYQEFNAGAREIDAIEEKIFSTRTDEEGTAVSSFKLTLQYEKNSSILKQLADHNISEDSVSASQKRIREAYTNSLQFLTRNFKTLEDLKRFYGYFLNKVTLIQIETPNISDALKIFETVNDRGVGLDSMDLLKNLIFIQVEPSQFDKLKTKWKEIVDSLDQNKEKPLRFLRYFIMANYDVKNAKGEEIVREDEIYDWISDPKNKKQCGYEEKPFEFIDFMLENVTAYTNFVKAKDPKGSDNVYLENITELSGSFRQHYILLLAARKLEPSLFNHFVKQIEALLFYYVLTGEQTKEFERKFSKWAKEVKAIKNKEQLNLFIQSNFAPEIKRKEADFEHYFINLGEGSLQNYRIMYILGKLAQHVDNQYLGSYEEKNLSSLYLTKGIEKEHILPQKPEPGFKNSFGVDYEDYMRMLGNLTLLEKPINIVLGRDFFEKKKSGYNDSKFYLTRSIVALAQVGQNTSVTRINSRLKSFQTWDRESIKERQEMLLQLAKEVWMIHDFE